MPNNMRDLTGMRFGRLTVLSIAGKNNQNNCVWHCICDCGNYKDVVSSNLLKGNTKSCGCFRKDRFKTHGLSDTKLHAIWNSMKQRCYNRKSNDYRWYGEKGVSICKEWLDFEKFYTWAIESGYKDGLSIDRIDNNIGYSPDNCRWIPLAENARRATQKLLDINGTKLNLSEWSKKIGLSSGTVERWLYQKGEEYTKYRILNILHPEMYSLKDAQDKNKHSREKYIKVGTETMNYTQWADRIGMSKCAFSRMIKNHGEEYAINRIKEFIA